MSDDRLWNNEECAAFLGISPQTLRRWVAQERVPYIKLGHSVRYDPAAIREWAQSHAIPPRPNHGVTNAFRAVG